MRTGSSALLTNKALGSHQLQSDFVGQDGGVAVGDVGEGAGVDKHGVSLRIQTTHMRLKAQGSSRQWVKQNCPTERVLHPPPGSA